MTMMDITGLVITSFTNNDIDTILTIINHPSLDKNLGLRLACHYGHLEIVKLLIQTAGATNINEGLGYAVYCGHIAIVKFLLDCGACHKVIPRDLVIRLLNDGYIVDNEYANMAITSRNQRQDVVKSTINNAKLSLYDINLTEIICDYINYDN